MIKDKPAYQEQEKYIPYTVRIPKTLHTQLLHIKADTGMQLQELIIEAIASIIKIRGGSK